jgi:hypothetical protein
MQALTDFKAFIIVEVIKVVTLPLFKKEEVVNYMYLRHWMHLRH